MASIIIFSILLILAFSFFGWNVFKVKDNILMGKAINRSDRKAERLKTMLLVAFGQKKMFQNVLPAILHFFIYAAFVITSIELLEIIVDGLSGHHRFFANSLGVFYVVVISTIELLSILAFVATIIFLARRNLLKVPRFHMDEMTGWPKLDGNIILYLEILLIICIFTMNGSDEVMLNNGWSHAHIDRTSYGFAVSSYLGPLVFGGFDQYTLEILERIGWWGHLIMVFGFLNYLPYSKHFHILLAFPNTYYSNLNQKGQFTNLSNVKAEVENMFDPNFDPYASPTEGELPAEPERFGAKDIQDLTWKSLMEAYTCTECGRCSSACPANQTGKKLSPRKIMMDTRDRMVEVGENRRKHGADYDDGKSLLGDYISQEEVWACTSCNACVQECPVNIDPLSIIIDLRRYLVMEESKVPGELATMLTNIENNGAPWQFSPTDRANWINEE